MADKLYIGSVIVLFLSIIILIQSDSLFDQVKEYENTKKVEVIQDPQEFVEKKELLKRIYSLYSSSVDDNATSALYYMAYMSSLDFDISSIEDDSLREFIIDAHEFFSDETK